MSSFTELRIIVTPTHVDKVQLLATDDDGEVLGLELYQKLIHEVQHFTKRANQILKGVACVPTVECLSWDEVRQQEETT